MALKDVTRAAVLQAIAEYDRLGREAFLSKYGFKPARIYFLFHESSSYDSKAIIGAAHAFASPEGEPLSASAFSGGEATVKRHLEGLGFEVVSAGASTNGRNPSWSADELLLALDLYLRTRPKLPGKRSEDVIKLSEELNALGELIGATRGARYRNPNGVYMKLCNFLRFDPTYTSEARVGLQRGGRLEEELWAQFASEPERLRGAVATIRSEIRHPHLSVQTAESEDDEMAEAAEGRIVTRLHRARERSRELVKKRKRQALSKYGCLACEACGFDFQDHYGDRGNGFIECHHTRPVHTLEPGNKTRLDDLALLCANCHRMIHAARPWLTIEELRICLTTKSAPNLK